VDSVVPPACFGRKPVWAEGIIKSALGFLARLGGQIAVTAMTAVIALTATTATIRSDRVPLAADPCAEASL
jgi:hypothetical protein